MQVDSKPEELDEIDRRLIQLKIEREALRKESDQASKDRLQSLEAEIANLEETSQSLTQRWEQEKSRLGDAQKLKGEGDAKAASIYASAFGRDPEFAMFYRSLDAYRGSFRDRSDVLVLDPSADFFKYFRGASPSSPPAPSAK